ncbi:MAG: phospholipid-binding protein MlaC [Polyangiales bacterium]
MSRSLSRFVRSFVVAGAFAGSVAAASTPAAPARASTSASAVGATKYLHDHLDKVQTILQSGSKDREKKVDSELAVLVDIDEMAKAALGDEWAKRTEAERKDFADTFRALVQNSIRKNLDKGTGYDVVYKDEKPQGGDVLVETELKNKTDKREPPAQVDYVMRKKGSDFMVVDYITEGSSATNTWRQQVASTLKKGSWDDLMKKMKNKLAKG